MESLACTGKELAQKSDVSESVISRYRKGERVPSVQSTQLQKLSDGLAAIARERGIPDMDSSKIFDVFCNTLTSKKEEILFLNENLDFLLGELDVNVSRMAAAIHYDASYISKIRTGKRTPSNPRTLVKDISSYIVSRFSDEKSRKDVADLIGCREEELEEKENYQELLENWMCFGSSERPDYISGFLKKLDEFNLDEYIHVIHFDKLKVPSVPFQIPTSRTYWGISEMMESELDFLKATVLSKSTAPVIMYSDMPMKEMAKDPEFPKKWMFGMALMLKKGLHLYQIHNLDRSFDEMMLGLESWIPMYMTGLISPYYLKNTQNNTFLHLLKVSGSAALSGEAITGYHENGKYYLTKSRREVEYYQRRANELLKNADSLMDIYRSEREAELNTFLISDTRKSGKRRGIRSTLPLYTISEELLERILIRHGMDNSQKQRIKKHVKAQKERIVSILASETLEDEVPALTPEEFRKNPPVLDLSGIFCETNLPYSEEEYRTHMSDTQAFSRKNSNYILRISTAPTFHNLQILIHEGQWAMISKAKAPAIHFVIYHPKLRNAIENFIPPIVE